MALKKCEKKVVVCLCLNVKQYPDFVGDSQPQIFLFSIQASWVHFLK